MRFVAWVLVALVVTGCGGRRFIDVTPQTAGSTPGRPAAAQPPDTLETFMAKMRKLSTEARPEASRAATLETAYPHLGAAIVAAAAAPSPAAYRDVSDEYRRFGIVDKAYEYLHKALRLDSRDAATHDALARLWRDSRLPHLALGDAHRAVYHAPASPVVRNTLGTVLQALGRRDLARAQYEQALQLDPAASYALNNLCYGWVLEANASKAISACERALERQPDLTAARHNLALAHAVDGNLAATHAAFDAAGDRGQALYNTGMVHLAQRRYRDAVQAFEAAHALRPTLTRAAERARQASAQAIAPAGGE